MDPRIVDGFHIVRSSAGEVINANEEVMPQGKERDRLQLIRDSRFSFAVKVIDKNQEFSAVDQDKINNHKYIVMYDDNQNKVLLKVRSIAGRLHMTEEQVYNALQEEGGMKRLEKQAKMISLLYTACIREGRKPPRRPLGQAELKDLARRMKLARDSDNAVSGRINNVELIFKRNSKGFVRAFEVGTKPLGEGGFGRVDSLLNIVSGHTFAMKILKPQALTEKGLHDLRNEAITLTFLNADARESGEENAEGLQATPRLVTVVSPGMPDAIGYLVKRYHHDYFDDVADPKYATRINSLQRVEEGRQLLSGLNHMHELGVIHGDLKLDNAYVEYAPVGENRVKKKVVIGDFGGAGTDVLERMRDPVLTREYILLGDSKIFYNFQRQVFEFDHLQRMLKEEKSQIAELIKELKSLSELKEPTEQELAKLGKLKFELADTEVKVLKLENELEALEKFKKKLSDFLMKLDVFALGMMIWGAVEGSPPYGPISNNKQGAGHLREIFHEGKKIDPGLRLVLKSMLHANYRKRPSSLEALNQLNEYLGLPVLRRMAPPKPAAVAQVIPQAPVAEELKVDAKKENPIVVKPESPPAQPPPNISPITWI